jgi:tRNA-modifying protein YgfZ
MRAVLRTNDYKDIMLVVSRPDLAVIVVSGSDRQTWLNGMLTCDLAKAGVGTATYGLAVTQKGRILADVIVVLLENEARLVVPASKRESLRELLEKHLIMEDAELSSSDEPVAFASGPEWRTVTAPLVVEYDALGQGGAILFGKLEGVATGDLEAWEALRVERGVPRFGVDFDDKTYPQEASLEKVAVAVDKGCYLGQEVVCMLELRGHVKRKLVPVVLDAETPPLRGAPVADEAGEAVGEVTSATTSPTLGKVVALAMVKRARAEPGQRVVIGGCRAEVVQRPA